MNKRGFMERLTGSVFIRLILIMMGAGFILNLVIGGTFRAFVRDNSGRILVKNISNHTDYIINDIGIPPDQGKAEVISRSSSFNIAIKGPGIEWSTTGSVPELSEYTPLNFHFKGEIMRHRRAGRFAYFKEKDGYTFIFFTDEKIHHRGWEQFLAIFIVSIILVLFVSYLLIRRILKPLRDLGTGVTEVSGGNLEYRVPVSGNNELSRLVISFNSMNERIKSMIGARDQLLLDVSHELRTPLTRMKVALEFVGEGNARKSISDDVIELEKMIAEILETERLLHSNTSIVMDESDIFKIIREVQADLGLDSESITITGESALVKCSREKIKIAVKNIIENAAKYSDISSSPIEIYMDENPVYTRVHFRDHGEGIPEAELELVFEPFYRVDRSRSRDSGGYGLGLSLCKKIMEACGGDINVSSITGEGTTVTLLFNKTD